MLSKISSLLSSILRDVTSYEARDPKSLEKGVGVNSKHAFMLSHWVSHCQYKTHKTEVRIIEDRREAGSEAGTSSRNKNQRTTFGDGFTNGMPICKGMDKVDKEKISTTAKPYVVPPKRYEFVICSIVMYF